MKTSRILLIGALALGAFRAVFAQDVPASVTEGMKRADEAIAKIVAIPDGQRTYENTVLALDDLVTKLESDSSIDVFLENVAVTAAQRDAGRAGDEAISNYEIEIGKREDLYNAIKAFAVTNPKLDPLQKRLLDFIMRDFRRNGMDLPKDRRDHLADVEKQINKLTLAFDQNVADDETRVPLTRAELKGIPEDVISKQPQVGGMYLVGMDYPTYYPAVENAQLYDTRKKLWVANRRRGGMKNVRVLEQVIKLRDEEAQILGFKNHADYVLEPRMAKNAQTVADFYTKLRPIIRKKAELDIDELTAAKREELKDPKAVLAVWDVAYYKNYLTKHKYAVDPEIIRQYFPMQKVVDGLFSIAQSLYGLQFKEVTTDHEKLGLPLWQEEVKLYEVYDKATSNLIGRFYFDTYPRPGKYNHAACWDLHPRKVWPDGTVQLPLAALVVNLTKPSADKPSLLDHDEVETFFHEFGHCLHNMMTESPIGRFSGTQVEQDFVEAPSQMFENWVWDPAVLRTFAKHYKTDQPLPEALLSKMKELQHLDSGYETEGQFYYGIVDQKYYTAPKGEIDTTVTGIHTMAEVELFKGVPNTYYQASFGHLMHYDAGYYGYEWSKVYAQDMFTKFQQMGLLNPEAGAYYRKKILARGGTMDAFDMLRDYLGREPKMDGYFERLGITGK